MNQSRSSQSVAFSSQNRPKQREHLQCFKANTPLQDVISCFKQQHKTLIMMRGLPGSGKSHLARNIKNYSFNGQIFCTDDFFYTSDGAYLFDPSKLPEYHARNLNNVRDAVGKHMSLIIVDNTNVLGVHMKPYVSLAAENGYEVYFIEPGTTWKFNASECAKRNLHGVPPSAIQRMLDDYENISLEQLIYPIKVRIANRMKPTNRTTSKPAFGLTTPRQPANTQSMKSSSEPERWRLNHWTKMLEEISPAETTGARAPANTGVAGSNATPKRQWKSPH
uniref:NEDD4-binding protein 2-like 1 n=1 Tax=Plectus sambesii TaxID=2011161 RepID=A0A914W373_9BILA